jgi:glyoxylase-like metal-dependent hydrolase (beta-lactamase superfamily II)
MRPSRGRATEVPDAPAGRAARVDVLLPGSLTATGGGVVSTCSLVQDVDRIVVVDPGMAARREDILDPLRRLRLAPEQVTDVVLSHHHPDHTINVALFPNAAVHDHWAIYRGADWEDSDAEGRELTGSIRLIRVPGHSAEDIALVAGTAAGIVVFTHLWWTADFPIDDPYSPDLAALRSSRARVLAFADMIVPGHAAPFKPGPATPR